jgi:hypothetical protein
MVREQYITIILFIIPINSLSKYNPKTKKSYIGKWETFQITTVLRATE